MKLSQYLPLLKGAKNLAHGKVTTFYHQLQKPGEFVGRVRTFKPINDADVLPDEIQIVQSRVPELLDEATAELTKLFDHQAAVDWGNANPEVRGKVIVGGKVLLDDVPVPYLLFLEKQLKDWVAILKRLPQLDPTQQWHWDADREEFFTEPALTAKTKRVTKHTVVVQATDRFPAQTASQDDDVVIGHWHTVYRSGAIHRKRARQLLERAEELADAVKVAREEANSKDVVSKRGIGATVFKFLLAE